MPQLIAAIIGLLLIIAIIKWIVESIVANIAVILAVLGVVAAGAGLIYMLQRPDTRKVLGKVAMFAVAAGAVVLGTALLGLIVVSSAGYTETVGLRFASLVGVAPSSGLVMTMWAIIGLLFGAAAGITVALFHTNRAVLAVLTMAMTAALPIGVFVSASGMATTAPAERAAAPASAVPRVAEEGKAAEPAPTPVVPTGPCPSGIPKYDGSAVSADNQRRARKLNSDGLDLLKTQAFVGAINTFCAALFQDPGSVNARYNLACAYNRAGWSADGMVVLEQLRAAGCDACLAALRKARSDADWRTEWQNPNFKRITQSGPSTAPPSAAPAVPGAPHPASSVKDAQAAYVAGDYHLALEKARQAIAGKSGADVSDAIRIGVLAACKLGDRAAAVDLAPRLSDDKKESVRKACEKNGITL